MSVAVKGWFVGERSEISGEQRRVMLELADGSYASMSKDLVVRLVRHIQSSELLGDIQEELA